MTKAEVVHAVRREMAQRLDDVVLRRTELGTAGHPGDRPLKQCAEVMAGELGWNEAHTRNEIQRVKRNFSLRSSTAVVDKPLLQGTPV